MNKTHLLKNNLDTWCNRLRKSNTNFTIVRTKNDRRNFYRNEESCKKCAKKLKEL